MMGIEAVVSKNIKRLLKEYNINQSELAKIAGVSESTVGKWVLEKATPRMGSIQKISDHFNLPKSYILQESKVFKFPQAASEYPYYPVSISAGMPIDGGAISENDVETISIPDVMMGRWAGVGGIYFTRANGDSMNKSIPHNSLMAVKQVELPELNDDDIVVYSDGAEFAVKRFYNDKENSRLLFRPDSTDNSFVDHTVTYENADSIRIHGKVVLHITELN